MNPVDPEPLGPLVLQLNKSTQELTKTVGLLADRVDTAEKRTEAIPLIQKITFALAVGALSLGAVLGWAVVKIDNNADHIEDLQTRTSSEVLCPLYGLFVQSVENPRPEQVDTPEERKRFEEAKTIILNGYAQLGCAKR